MKRPSPPAPPPKPLSVEHLFERQAERPSTSHQSSSSPKNRSRSTTTSSSTHSLGVINPVFVTDLVEETNTRMPLPSVSSKTPPQTSPLHSASSSISIESNQHKLCTVNNNNNNNNRRTVTASSETNHRTTEIKRLPDREEDEDNNHDCSHCNRYHALHHLGSPTKVPEVCSRPLSYPRNLHPSPYSSPLRPSPPPVFSAASYYLLGSDSRRHKHTHYHRNCRTCRQIVRETFERYYLQNPYANYLSYQQTMLPSSGTASRNSNGSGGSIDTNNNNNHHHQSHSARASLLQNAARYATGRGATAHAHTPPLVTLLPRRRANCGHSCLKYTILFYCSIAIILAICAICYLTRMFGYLSDQMTNFDELVVAGSTTSSPFDRMSSSFNVTADLKLMDKVKEANVIAKASAATSTNGRVALFDILPPEVAGVIVASALMIIFFLGLVGAFLESILCLRIFGAILSYLFLLTFGAALYIVILMVISRLPGKLVLSTISCAAVAITMHAAIAIAPFAFADLLHQEKEDERNELSTYYKYPSVRFLPMGASKSALNYFSFPFAGATGSTGAPPSRAANSGFRSRNFGLATTGHYNGRKDNTTAKGLGPSSSESSSAGSSSPNGAGHSRHHQVDGDNHSLEGLLPSRNHPPPSSYHHHLYHSGQTSNPMVRFNDNWL